MSTTTPSPRMAAAVCLTLATWLTWAGHFRAFAEEPAGPANRAASGGAESPPSDALALPIELSADDLKDLQAGGTIEIKGIGQVSFDEITTLAITQIEDYPRGRLVDIQGQPLVAAKGTVATARIRALSRGPECFDDETGPSRLADAEGRFVLPQLPDGYEPGRLVPLLVQTADGQSFETGFMPVEKKMIDVYLPTHLHPQAAAPREVAGDELAGAVVDEQGRPLEGVEVDIYEGIMPGLSARTDRDGRFSIKDLASKTGDDVGPLLVRFRKADYSPVRFLHQQAGRPGWVVALSNKTSFEGTISGSDGKPVAGALVRANQGPKANDSGIIGELWTEATTDVAGHYRLLVQPDEYEFFVRSPGTEVARLAKQPPIVFGESRRLDFALQPGATFVARVVDAQTNEPVPDVRLWHWQHPGVEGRSDANGKIVISGMFPGTFEFDVDAARHARWWSEEALSEGARKSIANPKLNWQRNFDSLDFDVQPDGPPVTIVVEKAVRIRGRVVDPTSMPVAGATVAPALTGSGNSLTGDTRFSAVTKADGTFEVELPASHHAKYNLVAHDGALNEWRTWANGVLPLFETRPGDEIDGVELKLTRPATVRGRIVDAQGVGLANVRVSADATDKLDNGYYVPPGATTDGGGGFELGFLRPGDYWLRAGTVGMKQFTIDEGADLGDVELQVDLQAVGRAAEKRRTR